MGMDVGGGGGKNPPPNVNITPLVDIVLVVLIIFMLVTPMMTKTFWLNIPKKPDEEQQAQQPKKNDGPLVLTLNKGGVIKVNKTVLTKEDLPARIPRMLAAKKQKIVYFDAHDEATYEEAIEVMDLARAGGARSIAILTEKVAD